MNASAHACPDWVIGSQGASIDNDVTARVATAAAVLANCSTCCLVTTWTPALLSNDTPLGSASQVAAGAVSSFKTSRTVLLLSGRVSRRIRLGPGSRGPEPQALVDDSDDRPPLEPAD